MCYDADKLVIDGHTHTHTHTQATTIPEGQNCPRVKTKATGLRMRGSFYMGLGNVPITEPSSPIDWDELAEAGLLDSSRTSIGNEIEKHSKRWSIGPSPPIEWDSWHSHLKSALFCIHSPARSYDVWILCHFVNSGLKRCFWLLPIGINQAGPTRRRMHSQWHLDISIPRLHGNGAAEKRDDCDLWI